MAYRAVCISQVTAAGGESVGHGLAERLGFHYVDDEVITVAAERAGVDPSVVESAEHHRTLLERLVDALTAPKAVERPLFPRDRSNYYAENVSPPMTKPIEDPRQLIQDAIKAIAEHGGVVIVAHGASMALAGRPDVLRVHVTASAATRIHRLWVPNKLISEDEYAKAIAESDRQRQRYLARFYDIHDESPTRYDLVINTDRIGNEHAVAAVAAIVAG